MKKMFAALGLLVVCGAVVTLAALIDNSSVTRIEDRAVVAPDHSASIDKATLDAQMAPRKEALEGGEGSLRPARRGE